jgi:anti-anti-sigma regulatory factor
VIRAMLRISVHKDETSATVQLQGRLAGPEVKELTSFWLELLATDPHKSIVVDLKNITDIDAAGKDLLMEMHRRRAQLLAGGCMTRAVVDDIKRKARRVAVQNPGR